MCLRWVCDKAWVANILLLNYQAASQFKYLSHPVDLGVADHVGSENSSFNYDPWTFATARPPRMSTPNSSNLTGLLQRCCCLHLKSDIIFLLLAYQSTLGLEKNFKSRTDLDGWGEVRCGVMMWSGAIYGELLSPFPNFPRHIVHNFVGIF